MIRFFFKSKEWQRIEQVFNAWKFLQLELPGIVAEDPLKAGFYEKFRRIDCPPMVKYTHDFNWETIKLDGYISNLHPFNDLDKIIDYGSEFRDVRHTTSYYVSIGYQEKAVKQDAQYHNNVQIWFQECETRLDFGFGVNSRYLERATLADLVCQIEDKTCFKIGDTVGDRPELGVRRPLDPVLPAKSLADGLKTIMDVVGYDHIFYSGWTLTCPSFDDARIQAIKSYNRVAELKIPAERYELEVVSRYNHWEAVEEMRPLYGPMDCLMHPLGSLKLPKRNKLGFHFLTCTEGHRFVVETNKPFAEVGLPTDLVHRLESLGIDFKRSYEFKELLNR